MALFISGCQSAVGGSNSQGASSQRAGSQQTAETVEKAPEVVEQPPVVDTSTYDVPPVSSSGDGVVLDEYGNIMGRMINGEFVPEPGYVAGAGPSDSDLLSQTIIFFDFDQSSIKPEFRDVLSAHAANIAANPGLSLRLEGHADERGSREYNIGLGERRAQAVKRALMLNGVSSGSLNTISFGEEKPLSPGTGESVWSQNRRVELVYK
jgi:peptidoglycan-associated lipoprotein